MPLVTGTRLGNYEIVSLLGAGGMGEVYRARDVRLDRHVAIKALPEAFARDPDRLARFEREARLLASVHHAHIASIFGIEDAGGMTYLAIELVEGETLAARLARGPLSVPAAIDICAQIASGLAAAHDQGVVHRDLKPGNVMMGTGGTVKVLDFGLAKGGTTDGGARSELTASPTVALTGTEAGVILGTAPYMSPEQARGLAVDRRADVWALGCVLFECLTGRRAFAGETTSDVIARILERDPDWDALPAAVPARLRDVLHRCLTKSVTERPRDIADLRGELLAIATDLSSSRSARAADATPSVAVLYFENLSPDSESDYFCAGITEDILTDLSKLKGMRVASRNAVARYRGTTVDIPKAAAELGVAAVLEGSVRRAGDRVRITAQLLKSDGFHLWAERYDRKLDDVFAVQDEIAAAIAGALRVALSPAETDALQRDRPNDVKAYDLYLRGRAQYRLYTPDSLREALRLFDQATQVDQDYALAWAGIGDACGQIVQWGAADEAPAMLRRGLEAARNAIRIDSRLAEGHKAEALVLGMLGEDDASIASLRRAIEVDPRHTPALGNLAVRKFSRGHVAGAERLFRRAQELDPVDAHTNLWMTLILALTGRWDEWDRLIERLRKVADHEFYLRGLLTIRAMALVIRDRHQELVALLEEARNAGMDDANMAMIDAYQAARSGRTDLARRRLAERGDSASLHLGACALAARTALMLGEPGRAVQIFSMTTVAYITPTIARLDHGLHPLLGHAPFAPRVSPHTLVWPLEAPMIDATRHGLFREVRIESGVPDASDILKGL
jgi:serine/threonine protein kinase/tetratricopeptide (TPR) repeat protein